MDHFGPFWSLECSNPVRNKGTLTNGPFWSSTLPTVPRPLPIYFVDFLAVFPRKWPENIHKQKSTKIHTETKHRNPLLILGKVCRPKGKNSRPTQTRTPLHEMPQKNRNTLAGTNTAKFVSPRRDSSGRRTEGGGANSGGSGAC